MRAPRMRLMADVYKRQLLAELGWRRNAGGRFERNGEPLKLRLIVSNITAGGDQTRDRDGEILRVQLEKAGFTVEARNLETAAADSLIVKWDFDLAISSCTRRISPSRSRV